MTPDRTIRIGLLICGALSGPVAENHGDYYDVYNHYLKAITPRNCNANVVVDSYMTRMMEFPSEDKLDDYDLFMITGSAHSAYDDSVPWNRELLSFLKGLIENHPKVRIFGICFGHQILGRVFGGECVHSGRWEVGPTSIALTDVGKSVFGVDQLCIQQMHRDLVPMESLSKQFESGEIELLGSTGHTGNQGFIKYYPSSSGDARTHRDIHILTVQGHPEFSESLVTDIVKQRAEIIGHPTASDYWGHKGSDYDGEPTDKEGTGRRWHKTDGCDVVARVLWKMLGVTSLTDDLDGLGGREVS